MVKQRTREIGLRIALGARTGQIIWEIVRHGFMLTIIGIGFGLPASLSMGRVLESQLYQVFIIDLVSMALSGLALGMVVLLASYLPERRAAANDPITALRQE
jgi:ABC-type antimicrobial peptide transport system permease subunit